MVGAVSLTSAQVEVVLFELLNPGTPTYNVPIVAHLTGPLSVDALHAAITATIARHPALRLRIPRKHRGRPVGEVLDEVAVDMRVAERADSLAAASAWATAQVRRPFDLGTAPLLHAALCPVGSDESLLVLVAHHLVVDAHSLRILLRDVSTAYNGGRLNTAGPAGAGGDSGVPASIEPGWGPNDLNWWRKELEGAPSRLALPYDRPHPVSAGHAGGRVEFDVGAELPDRFGAMARAHDVTEFVALLAVFAALIGRTSSSREVVIGTPFANRMDPESLEVMGFVANTLPVRIDLSGGRLPFSELMTRTREAVYGVMDHQSVPLDAIVRAIRPTREPRFHPLFQVLYGHSEDLYAELELRGIVARPLWLSAGAGKLDLTLTTRRTKGRGALSGMLDYRTDIFDRSTVAGLADGFIGLLSAVVHDPDAPV